MDLMRTVLAQFTSLFRRRTLDTDLAEELPAHIALATEENINRGLPHALAKTEALRAFGGLTQTREAYRVQRGMPLLEQFTRDLQFAFRQLRKSPAFALPAAPTTA